LTLSSFATASLTRMQISSEACAAALTRLATHRSGADQLVLAEGTLQETSSREKHCECNWNSPCKHVLL